jgi:ABC-type oligopeptide transport system ATPase subunit
MLKLDSVWKVYKIGAFGGRELPAVRDVSFEVTPGEVVSLIGESGSGKITFEGTDVSSLGGRKLKDYYRSVQGVFQDPFSSYNPIFKADRVFRMIRQTYYPRIGGGEWDAKLHSALEAVTLDPTQVLNKFPHQLSGGQLQRLLIARALLLDIKLLIADEIISMLDASTRIDVLNLLGDLKARGLGIIFITHDLSLGNYISERTIILRRGLVVEMGATEKVFGNPQHAYTRMLLASVPQLHRKWEEVAKELEVEGMETTEREAFEAAYKKAGEAVTHDAADSVLVEHEPDHLVRVDAAVARERQPLAGEAA